MIDSAVCVYACAFANRFEMNVRLWPFSCLASPSFFSRFFCPTVYNEMNTTETLLDYLPSTLDNLLDKEENVDLDLHMLSISFFHSFILIDNPSVYPRQQKGKGPSVHNESNTAESRRIHAIITSQNVIIA